MWGCSHQQKKGTGRERTEVRGVSRTRYLAENPGQFGPEIRVSEAAHEDQGDRVAQVAAHEDRDEEGCLSVRASRSAMKAAHKEHVAGVRSARWPRAATVKTACSGGRGSRTRGTGGGPPRSEGPGTRTKTRGGSAQGCVRQERGSTGVRLRDREAAARKGALAMGGGAQGCVSA